MRTSLKREVFYWGCGKVRKGFKQNVPQSPGSESSRARQKKHLKLLLGVLFLNVPYIWTSTKIRKDFGGFAKAEQQIQRNVAQSLFDIPAKKGERISVLLNFLFNSLLYLVDRLLGYRQDVIKLLHDGNKPNSSDSLVSYCLSICIQRIKFLSKLMYVLCSHR